MLRGKSALQGVGFPSAAMIAPIPRGKSSKEKRSLKAQGSCWRYLLHVLGFVEVVSASRVDDVALVEIVIFV